MAALEDNRRIGDLDGIRAAAHKLKGSAGVLGARALQCAAGEIVDHVQRGEVPGSEALLKIQREADLFRKEARML